MAKDRDDEIEAITNDLEALRTRARKLNLTLVVSLIGMAVLNVNYPEPSPYEGVYQDNLIESSDDWLRASRIRSVGVIEILGIHPEWLVNEVAMATDQMPHG